MYVFCLLLKFTSLQIQARLPRAPREAANASIPSHPAKTNPYPSRRPRCQPARPAAAGRLGAQEQSGPQEGREEKQFQTPGAQGLLQTAIVRRRENETVTGSLVAPLGRERISGLGAAAQGRERWGHGDRADSLLV